MLVRPSMRAASLEVNQVSGVSGFVLPGDRVDVLVTVDNRGNNDEAVTRTVLQNIEVLAAGQKTEQQDNKPITVQSVTVLVDPSGAEALALSLQEGKIHLVLRNPEDNETSTVASLSTREMLGEKLAAKAEPRAARSSGPRPQTQVAAVTPRQTEKAKIRIIRSASVTETPAVSDSTER
jgi:pilus assembly protein CpaB